MIPSSQTIQKVRTEIERQAASVTSDYRWLAACAFERPRHGESRAGSDVPDISGVIVATAPVRRSIERAARAVFAALGELERAQAELNDAAATIDRGIPPGPQVADARYLPRTASRLEIARAKAARDRRRRRAEGSGDHSEVVG